MMMLGVLLLQSFLMQTANPCAASIAACLTAPFMVWFPIAVIASIAVISVLIIIHQLSGFIGRSDVGTWVRVKIYDVLFSMASIVIFLAIATPFFTINLTDALKSVQLVPTECQSSSNLNQLAICNMDQFNKFTATANQYLYSIILILSIQSSLGLNFNTAPLGAFKVSFDISRLEFIPALTSFKYLGTAVDALFFFVLANDVQLILLSASALIFSIFMTIGLIARIFGVTRTFGGSMIAFALGIGLVYPLLVSITYGFINYGLDNVTQYFGVIIPATIGLSWISFISVLLISLPSSVFGFSLVNLISEKLFLYMGLVSIGLVFIPLINLVIVDVFIIDFSTAIGERMDFLTLLIRVV